MNEKKKLLLNCSVCDTRKIVEEEYLNYNEIMVNADLIITDEKSKHSLNRLPLTMNQDQMIILADGVEAEVKSVNGFYEISEKTKVQEHTILIVNGSLNICSGTETVLSHYEHIIVNGSVKCPQSLDGLLLRLSVNGSLEMIPDDCVALEPEFVIDRFFPLRAVESCRYYAAKAVIVKDKEVDITKLVQKRVQFVTKQFIVPECKIEECVPLFEKQAECVAIPDGMHLVYGNSILDKELIRKAGSRFFVYGNLKVEKNMDLVELRGQLEKVIVRGKVMLGKKQLEEFCKLDAEYDELEIIKNGRIVDNVLNVRLDKNLFDHSPDGIEVYNAANVVIAEDVTPEMILEKLTLQNCVKVVCCETQMSSISAIGKNVIKIGTESEFCIGFGEIQRLSDTTVINAEQYVM